MQPEAVIERLRAAATPETLAGLRRYGIPDDRAFGVAMRDMQAIAKAIGKDQALAEALWETGWYEARTVAVFLAEPARLARARADDWAADFDNWAICDTACFHLFDRAPWAWSAVPDWMAGRAEFVRRAGFALVWALALHDKAAPDTAFEDALRLIETADPDTRPLVRKAAEMALGAVARRPALTEAATATARRMAADPDAGRAWVGRTALSGIEKARGRKR